MSYTQLSSPWVQQYYTSPYLHFSTSAIKPSTNQKYCHITNLHKSDSTSYINIGKITKKKYYNQNNGIFFNDNSKMPHT